MSATIRPGGGVTPGATGAEAATEVAPTSHTPASALDRAGAASAVASAPAAQLESPTAAMLSRLDAGALTREQAIEGLVAQALELHGGARLPAAQRGELEAVLRAALLDDPALASLLG
ncbi:MAG: hypothetical protein JWN48_2692 [Myxococcaceae bacterium]|nr:hypothetical protein [Myxococcaceae bacterium]